MTRRVDASRNVPSPICDRCFLLSQDRRAVNKRPCRVAKVPHSLFNCLPISHAYPSDVDPRSCLSPLLPSPSLIHIATLPTARAIYHTNELQIVSGSSHHIGVHLLFATQPAAPIVYRSRNPKNIPCPASLSDADIDLPFRYDQASHSLGDHTQQTPLHFPSFPHHGLVIVSVMLKLPRRLLL